MADDLGRALDSPAFAFGVSMGHWKLLRRDGDRLVVEFTAADGSTYQMLLECQNYGEAAIGGRFVDPATRMPTVAAWPRGNATFQQWVKFTGELFICWDQDRFGIERHPDWNYRKAWTTATPNQLVAYLTFIARLLNSPSMGYELRPAPHV